MSKGSAKGAQKDMDDNMYRKSGSDPAGENQETQNTVNTDFMKEQIKQRPVNRKKLLRRTLVTAFLAVLFGAVACAAFLGLEPFINRALNPQEKPAQITLPSEDATDEMLPEDMIASDDEIVQQEVDEKTKQQAYVDKQTIKKDVTREILADLEGTVGYTKQYDALSEIANDALCGIVTVSGLASDYDWAGDAFENTLKKTSGLIIADNEYSYYILSSASGLTNADTIRVGFFDGEAAEASIKAVDSITGLAVLTVKKSALPKNTISGVKLAKLGSSERSDLLGQPVIAVGSPSGTAGSVSYGIVTNAALPLDITDSLYEQITTDIYGSTKATGVLIDLGGNVIGWIDMSHNKSDSPNLISAIGVTQLKGLVEKLSNNQDVAFIGIHGVTVPDEVNSKNGVPNGVYVTRVEMDSPAMEGGIQSGDVITCINGRDITDLSGFVDVIRTITPGHECTVTVKRQTANGYSPVTFKIETESRFE